MIHRNNAPNPPVRLRSPKNDIAPMIFFPDILLSNNFPVPVLPIPFRIDRMTNELPTLIIIPDLERISNFCLNTDLLFDFKTFITHGLRNFVQFGQKKYKEITFRSLKSQTINEWFLKSLSTHVTIPSLIDEFTFIILEFLNLIQNIEREKLVVQDERYNLIIESYSGKMLEHFRDKLTQNSFIIQDKDEPVTYPIFKEKKGKYYPEIVPIEVSNSSWKKPKKMNIVPYLFYDDIIDCYAYNTLTASSDKKKILDLPLYFQYGILQKGTISNEHQKLEDLRKFNLKDLSFESIITG